MRGVGVTKFGNPREILRVLDDFEKPTVAGTKQMLVKVLACSTSPGDWRTMSGSVDYMRHPPFPYIPSQDVCGIVEELDGTAPFQPGDCVICSWNSITPMGGMAEYILVDPALAVPKPASLTVPEGAAVANSACHAWQLLHGTAEIKSGDRVLVIGGSGGVGTALVQIARHAGASFVASVSTQGDLMRNLGVDRNVDYPTQNWWEVPEFKENKFDIVVDCAEGLPAWKNCHSVLKSKWKGGRFVACVMSNPWFEIHRIWGMFALFLPILWRTNWTWLAPLAIPRWKAYIKSVSGDTMVKVVELAEAGTLKVVLHPGSPFPFTDEGVREAFEVQASKHAHGKVVVEISSKA